MKLSRKIKGKLHPLFYRGIKWYYGKPRQIKMRGIHLKLYPTVFHPNLYLSTDVFLSYLLTQEIEYENILELGAGSGLISLHLAKYRKSKMVASDINPQAVDGLCENAKNNKVNIRVIQSDLFEHIPNLNYKFILINPPYTAKNPKSIDEQAFFCGEKLEYFKQLFQESKYWIQQGPKILMILSEIAPINDILNIAKANDVKMKSVYVTKRETEEFTIFHLC